MNTLLNKFSSSGCWIVKGRCSPRSAGDSFSGEERVLLEPDLQGMVPGLLLQSWIWVIYDASGTDYPKKMKGIQGLG